MFQTTFLPPLFFFLTLQNDSVTFIDLFQYVILLKKKFLSKLSCTPMSKLSPNFFAQFGSVIFFEIWKFLLRNSLRKNFIADNLPLVFFSNFGESGGGYLSRYPLIPKGKRHVLRLLKSACQYNLSWDIYIFLLMVRERRGGGANVQNFAH